MILEKNISKFNSKSIKVAQKCKKKILTEIFDIFEHLLSQNPANQDSQLS